MRRPEPEPCGHGGERPSAPSRRDADGSELREPQRGRYLTRDQRRAQHRATSGSAKSRMSSRTQSPAPSLASESTWPDGATPPSSDEEHEETPKLTNDRPKSLHEGTVKPITTLRYEKAKNLFQAWWVMTLTMAFPDAEDDSMTNKMKQLIDTNLATYLEHLYSEDKSKAMAVDVICGLQWFWPGLRGSLRKSWRLLKAWQFIVPCKFRSPWPVQLVLAVVALCFLCQRTDLALAVALMFHCILRPSECSALRKCDITVGEFLKFLEKDIGIVSLFGTKTARTAGRGQHCTISSKLLLQWLESYLSTLQDADMLFPSYSSMRHNITLILAALLPDKHNFTLGGIRAGGATYLYLKTENVGLVQRKGRWRSARTLEHYIQEGAAILSAARWPPEVHAKIDKLARSLPGLF